MKSSSLQNFGMSMAYIVYESGIFLSDVFCYCPVHINANHEGRTPQCKRKFAVFFLDVSILLIWIEELDEECLVSLKEMIEYGKLFFIIVPRQWISYLIRLTILDESNHAKDRFP